MAEELKETIPFRYAITSYGADYPVDGLVKRIASGDIIIPSFQRGYVWTFTQASRFIESLLLGLPVPGIFLSKEEDTQKLLVIDGQQRLRTLQFFYEGVFQPTRREFALRDVQPQFQGATYKSLPEKDRRQLNDSILHATIIRQDEPSDDDSSIYHIFERLNTGGTLLHAQEIRASIYHGKFNELLKQLNRNESWRAVYGPIHPRMRDQELILRFLAFYFNGSRYTKPMKEFLNIYMGRNRHLDDQMASSFITIFENIISLIYKAIGRDAFKPKRTLNAAVYDAVMVGIARRLEKGNIQNFQALRQRYDDLLASEEFVTATETATTDEENVKRRMAFSTRAFADVE